nr:DUF3795 domain-containing protein [Clostridioides difficile]
MTKSICGVDCRKCELSNTCNGCAKTKGHPFGSECMVALCLKEGKDALCSFKKNLIRAFNALNIQDMEEVTELNALKGSFINIEYTLPKGQLVKFWDDNKIYFGNQLRKKDSDRYYGIIADEKYLMVSEYSGYGSDAEIVVFKRWM